LYPSDKEAIDSGMSQKTLIFAKKYAAYLVGYEQALAGGAKGFTVQFQKRFNELMQSNQFNPEGFKALMDEQISEISRRQARNNLGINRNVLTKMGDYISKQGEDAGKIDSASTETPSNKPAPTAKDREYARSHPEHLQDFRDHFGQEP
jgi:hypothetical protein